MAYDVSRGTVYADGTPVPRELRKRFADVINVKDFGAKGDGITDDTAAFQSAINALPINPSVPVRAPKGYANGGILFIPTGRYRISDRLMTKRGMLVLGEGAESSQILSFSPVGLFTHILADGGGYVPDALTFIGLSIWQDASITPVSGAGIEIVPPITAFRAVRLYARDIIIEGTYYGIKLANTIGSSVQDTILTKTVSHGLYVVGPVPWIGAHEYILGLHVTNSGNRYICTVPGVSAGSGGPSGTGSDIVDGTAHWAYVAAEGTGTATSTSTRISNTYAYLSATGDGFHIEASTYFSLYGCASDSNKHYGYQLNSTNGFGMYHCGAEQNGRGGVHIFLSTGPTIVGLTVVQGAAAVDYDPLVWTHGTVWAYVNAGTIIGSMFSGADSSRGYGIWIDSISSLVSLNNSYLGLYFSTQSETSQLTLASYGKITMPFSGGANGRFAFGAQTPDALATLLLGGTQPLRLGSTSGPIVAYGTAAPVTGTWTQGSRVINSAATVGQPKGWICTVAGTPGTWVSEGIL